MPPPRAASSQTLNVLRAMLSRPAQWQHGYELCGECDLKSGTLYPILMRLSDRGMLESRWEPSEYTGRPPRKLYRLTAQGVRYAREESRPMPSTRLLSPGKA